MPSFKHKTKENRVKEIVELYHKLNSCGFPTQLDGIVKFKKILSKWVNDGEYTKGRINLNGYERIVHYELYIQKNVEIAVNLVYVKGL